MVLFLSFRYSGGGGVVFCFFVNFLPRPVVVFDSDYVAQCPEHNFIKGGTNLEKIKTWMHVVPLLSFILVTC